MRIACARAVAPDACELCHPASADAAASRSRAARGAARARFSTGAPLCSPPPLAACRAVRRSLPVTGSHVVDGLAATAIVLAVAPAIGLVALWPHGKIGGPGPSGPARTYGVATKR